MTDKLPPNLAKLFTARPPLDTPVQLDRKPEEWTGPRLNGVGEFLAAFKAPATEYLPTETMAEKKKRLKEEAKAKREAAVAEGLAEWAPSKNPAAEGMDAYKTLFVGRLSYNVNEEDMRAVFGRYGEVRKVVLVNDKEGKPRGYGFVEYDRERDMRRGYEGADGMKMLDRRIVVDVERGRTVKGWRPKRLGGGLGQTRVGHKTENQRFAGRDPSLAKPVVQAHAPPPATGGYGGGGGGGGGGYGDRYRGGGGSGYGGDRRDHRDHRGGDRYGGDRDRDRYGGGRDRERERSPRRERGYQMREYDDRRRDDRRRY